MARVVGTEGVGFLAANEVAGYESHSLLLRTVRLDVFKVLC